MESTRENNETTFDTEFLKGVLESKDEKGNAISADDMITKIFNQHEANTRGLVQKRDELLGKAKEFQEQIKSFAGKETEYGTKIKSLEEQLSKNSSEETKKYYEQQLAGKQKEFSDNLAKVTGERDFYKQSHLKRLEDDAVADGIKSLQFLDGLKDGFVARVLMVNQFSAKDIDGNTIFLNKDNKSIQEAIKEFSLTPEGKAYLKNPSSGGGAHSGNGSGASGAGTWTREEYNNKQRSNPKEVIEFFRNGGKIA